MTFIIDHMSTIAVIMESHLSYYILKSKEWHGRARFQMKRQSILDILVLFICTSFNFQFLLIRLYIFIESDLIYKGIAKHFAILANIKTQYRVSLCLRMCTRVLN